MCLVAFAWEKPDSLKKLTHFEENKQVAWAIVEISENCNFKCSWCYNDRRSNRKMIFAKVKEVVDILANSGIKQITFSGGEPLMHPDIVKMVRYTTNFHIIPHILSNGYYLDKKLAKRLAEAGLSQMQMNIDSLNPVRHDNIRKKKGAFNHAIQGLKNAIDFGITAVSQTVITKDNIHELKDIVDFSYNLGIRRFRVWDLTPAGFAEKNSNILNPKFVNYVEILEDLFIYVQDLGCKGVLSYEPLFPLNNIKDNFSNMDIKHFPCPNRMGLLVNILVDGSIIPCSTIRRPTLYNIFDYSEISQIHSVKTREYWGDFKVSPKCKKCDYFKVCRGGCYVRCKWNNGFDYQCKVEGN